jgi:Uma2 family endonuclease
MANTMAEKKGKAKGKAKEPNNKPLRQRTKALPTGGAFFAYIRLVMPATVLLPALPNPATVSHDLRQIINGITFMPPSPLAEHQESVSNFYDALKPVVKTQHAGKVFLAPLDVIFEEGVNRVQPDVLFIANEHQHIIQDWIRGVPDLVVEVVSPPALSIVEGGIVRMDRVEKKALYERYGVAEYWIISPAEQSAEVYALDEAGKYFPFSVGEKGDTVQSRLLPGFEVEVATLFQ